MSNRTLKQSTAANVMIFMTASSDHVSGLAGATLTITASKDGAAFASISPTVTDRGSGWYNLALTTGNTDTLGDLCLHITATSADPTDLKLLVIAADLADATRLGLSALPNAAAEAAGGLYTRGTGAGQINQDANGRIDANVKALVANAITSTALDATAVSAIATGIMTYAHRAGHTLRGFVRRMDALFFGKATGLTGTSVVAYQPGGVLTEFTATQNPSAGLRDAVDVTTSES